MRAYLVGLVELKVSISDAGGLWPCVDMRFFRDEDKKEWRVKSVEYSYSQEREEGISITKEEMDFSKEVKRKVEEILKDLNEGNKSINELTSLHHQKICI